MIPNVEYRGLQLNDEILVLLHEVAIVGRKRRLQHLGVSFGVELRAELLNEWQWCAQKKGEYNSQHQCPAIANQIVITQ